MKNFVPYEKMSKKQKREQDQKRRGTWQVSPVTRIAETDKKHYSRKTKHKNSGEDDPSPLFCYCCSVQLSSGRIVTLQTPSAMLSTVMRRPVPTV